MLVTTYWPGLEYMDKPILVTAVDYIVNIDSILAAVANKMDSLLEFYW
jgi:hypothetical protein